MKKVTIAAMILNGCAVTLPTQQPATTVTTSSQPATSTSTPSTDTAGVVEASLAKSTMPTKSESSLFGWLFPDRLKNIDVPTGRSVIGMWMYNSPDDGEVQEFAYNIAWMSKAQKLEDFAITVNHVPAFEASAPDIVYNALTLAYVSNKVAIGNSARPASFDHIIAWATIPKEAQALGLQVTLDVTKVKSVATGKTFDPGVPAMAADAVIVRWWQ